jgi:tetratricopeptide (TPR) repeat protein
MSRASEKRVVVFSLLLVVGTLVCYNPIVRNQFTDFDDSVYVLRNAQVQTGLTWATAKWSFATFHAGYWHPLTWLSHALDCEIFLLNPAGHHYVNLLLHTANAVLLFLLLQQATGLTWSSLLVGALFALHPINVESVAWIAERKNVLSMLFFLLAVLAYDRYARIGRRYLFWWAAVLFALGLMAKPQIVTLPFVLLLWDYWPLQRMNARSLSDDSVTPVPRSFGFLLWEKWPFFILAAVDSVITVIAQRAGSAVRTAQEVQVSARFENALVSYVRYLEKMFWPTRLAPMYPHPGNSLAGWQVVGAAVLLILVSALVWHWRSRRYLVFGWLWFLGTLVPMIGIVAVGEQAMADRFAYIPFIGLFVAVVWAAGAIVAKYRIPAVWPATVAGCLLLILGCLTYRQLGYWHDDETLWRYTLSVTQQNYMAHDNLALALAKEGRSDEAVVEFRAAEALHRYPPGQILELASYENRVGHPQEAIEECDSVLHSSPDRQIQAAAWSELGQAQLQVRQYDEAERSFQDALRVSPENGPSLVGSGVLALRARKPDAAVSWFARAVKVEPSAVNFLLLAQSQWLAGHPAEADLAAVKARDISPDLSASQIAAGQLLSAAGLVPR